MKRTRTLGRVMKRLRPYSFLLFLSLSLSGASVVLTLLIPRRIGSAIDAVIGAGNVDFPALFHHLLYAGIFAACAAVLQWICSAINQRISFMTVRDLRDEAFSHLQTLPLSYLDSHPQGDIVSRITADAEQFGDGLLLGFAQLFSGIVTIVCTLVFMLTIHPLITLLVIALTPLSLFAARFIARRTYSLFKAQSQARGDQTALVDELIAGQKVVRAFTHEGMAQEAFDEKNEKLSAVSLKAIFFSSLTNPVTRFINALIYAAVTLCGGLSAIGGGLSVGALSCLLSYVNQYTKPFNEISGVFTEFQNALACVERLFVLIDTPSEIPDPADAATLGEPEGRVVLSDVAFSYVPERPLIEDLNLTVEPGCHVAIVGPTGCGKTTLINLLMRFYDVCDGSIQMDGVDIRRLRRHDLRRRYGMVLQETWLKAGTVRENITMGKPDASDEEVIRAARAAHAHSFIKRLPQGYDTVLGEGGEGLSQGQKQLLCIARIMLCPPPVLILDEATSSIDTRTEMKIQQAFSELMRGRTSFVVAHRLSTIRDADVILVMRDGHIIEKGNHETLLAQNGFYAHLYNSQFAPV